MLLGYEPTSHDPRFRVSQFLITTFQGFSQRPRTNLLAVFTPTSIRYLGAPDHPNVFNEKQFQKSYLDKVCN